VAQTEQLPPGNPHAPVVLPGWHVLFWQQPFGHEAALHTHAPATQA